MINPYKYIGALLLPLLCGACSLSPTLKIPETPVTERYQESGITGTWTLAATPDQTPSPQAWWTIFNDATLNDLQQRAFNASPSIAAAAARLQQADALQRQSNATLLPTVNANANATRYNNPQFGGKATSNYNTNGLLSYEVSTLFRLRDTITANRANHAAAQSLLYDAQRVMSAMVAQNYFTLRRLQTEENLLERTVVLRTNSLALVQKRYDAGETTQQDVFRAQSELASTSAEHHAVIQDKLTMTHLLASLLGESPSTFKLADGALPVAVPPIPQALPSTLLQRRPDIQAAQQTLRASNARIGLARAAFFPSINLTASGGLASPDLGDLFNWSSRSWAVGSIFGNGVLLPLYDGGSRIAGVDLAKGQYAENIANYRGVVLDAFRDVEDALSNGRQLSLREMDLEQASHAAQSAQELAKHRYDEGEIDYIEWLDTQRDALTAQRAWTTVHGARFVTLVQMIRALGGGWIQG